MIKRARVYENSVMSTEHFCRTTREDLFEPKAPWVPILVAHGQYAAMEKRCELCKHRLRRAASGPTYCYENRLEYEEKKDLGVDT